MTKNITMEIQNLKNHQVDHLPRLILYMLHIFFLEKNLYKKILIEKTNLRFFMKPNGPYQIQQGFCHEIYNLKRKFDEIPWKNL